VADIANSGTEITKKAVEAAVNKCSICRYRSIVFYFIDVSGDEGQIGTKKNK
jgi:hypothetical protein